MKLIINHLTRMRAGFICVAGIDLETKRHIRPVLFNHLTTAFLADQGGYFGLAHSLDLGWVQAVGQPPEMEDVRFEPRKIRRKGQFTPAEFWKMLQEVSQTNLSDIFGPDLKPKGHSAIVEVGNGRASLGCLSLPSPPDIFVTQIDGHDRLRLGLNDGPFNLDLSITDLRFYEEDHVTLKKAVVEQVRGWCELGGPAILSVGLTRPRTPPGGNIAYHWLQVNNLHFENYPVW